MNTVREMMNTRLDDLYQRSADSHPLKQAHIYLRMAEEFKNELAENLTKIEAATETLEIHLQLDVGLKMAIDSLTKKAMECQGYEYPEVKQ